MATTHDVLPDDVDALQALVFQQREVIEARDVKLDELAERLEHLEEMVRLLRSQHYGRSSESSSSKQLGLFNEAESLVEAAETAVDKAATVAIEAHTRAKRGRKPLPSWIPRREILHDLPEAQKVCSHDGTRLERIGEETSEQLEFIPAQVEVLRHIRPKYACPTCKTGVKTAPPPLQLIPKSLASPSLLAFIAVSKYADALPLYRQEKMLTRIGVELSRATLAHWMVKLGDALQPVMNLMREDLLSLDLLACDETRYQVLKEPGKRAESQSYLWAQYGGTEARPILLFDYDPSRSGEVPKRLLEGFSGTLQTDGYAGYDAVVSGNGLTHIGCWAHARRKFVDAQRGQGKNRKKGQKKRTKQSKAQQGIEWIDKLYRIERQLQGKSPEERARVRQEHAKPIVKKIRLWLDTSVGQVPPQSLVGKALMYLDKQWPKLIRYLDDGRVPIDTNRVENAIRPFVLGRKNWMFADTQRGAHASANLYSVIETAKANGLEPYAYLRHLFQELPKATTLEQIEKLLPHQIDPQVLPDPTATEQPPPRTST